MELWWSDLGIANKVFYAIGIATSFVLALQLIATLFGLGDEADIDESGGLGILSVRTVTAFFAGFGWGGVAALAAGLALLPAIAVALVTGGALMAGVVALMRLLYAMRYSGTLDYRNAVGETGSVYLPVPAAMAGPGKIEVLVQGRLCVVRAFTRAAVKIPNRARVRVVELLDQQTLLVEPLDSPQPAAAIESAAPEEGR